MVGRRVVNAGLRAGLLDQLWEHQLRTAARRRLGDPFAQHRLAVLRQHRQKVAVVEPGVPDVEHVHGGKVAHFSAIAAGAGDRRIAAVRVGEPVRTGGEHKRGDEPLDVPLPGCRQCLVEIVDVEDEPALRRGKAAEIHQMAVAAHLDMDAAHRRAGQIGRHDAGGPAVKGEWRLQHAAIAQRHQIRLPSRIGGLENADRVGSLRRRPPGGMRVAGRGVAQPLAVSPSVRGLYWRWARFRLQQWRLSSFPPFRAFRVREKRFEKLGPHLAPRSHCPADRSYRALGGPLSVNIRR